VRATTGGEAAVLTSDAFTFGHRVKVQNGSGTYIDLTAYLISAEIDFDIDQPIAAATLLFTQGEGTSLLSPLRSDSTLNVDDTAVYSPLLDAGRQVKIEVYQIAYGTSPIAGDYKNIFEGVIDRVEYEGTPIKCVARDLGAQLVDRFCHTPRTYDNSSVPIDMEDLIQDVLDNEFGAGVVNLYTPSSPSYLIALFRNERESLLDALQRIALSSIGWDLRYRWDSGSSSWRLTLADPQRSKTTPDATIASSLYVDITGIAIDRTQVRNYINVAFGPSTARDFRLATDASSINRFGQRELWIEEPEDSPIDSATEAVNMANNILSDLALPKADLVVEMLFYWPVELNDLLRFSANSYHFNSNQDLSVVGIRHVIGQKNRTLVTCRGTPAGAYRAWIARRFHNPNPTRNPPTASVTFSVRNRANELVSIDGDVGGADSGPLEYRYKTGNAAFSAWVSSPALPQVLVLTRPETYAIGFELQTRQNDGQVAKAYYSIPSIIDDTSGPAKDETSRGRTTAGVPAPGVQVLTGNVYNIDADTPLIDTTTRQMQTALAPSRAAQYWQDSKYPLQADTSDGTTTVSTAIEPQASLQPVPTDIAFTSNIGAPGTPNSWVCWTWLAATAYRPGSGALALAACTTMFAQPSAPTCTTVAGGGPAGARNYYVRVGYMKDGKVYRVSAEQASAPTAVGATNRLKVTSPGAVAGYDGWCVLIGTATNTEVFQSDVPATALIAFGTDYTEPAGGAATAGKTPYNSAMLNGITEIGLSPSLTYYWYPYYKPSDGLIYLYSGLTVSSQLVAYEATRDGRLRLAEIVSSNVTKTHISATTPASGTTTGSGGGRY
jgi:hypothetical protein